MVKLLSEKLRALIKSRGFTVESFGKELDMTKGGVYDILKREYLKVVIPDAFRVLIKEMKLHKYSPDDYIFGRGLLTGPVSVGRNSVTMLHKKFLNELNFHSHITMYSWKATGNINAFKAGIDIYSIMRQNRHASINQTMTYLKSLGLYPNVEFRSKMK